MKYNIGKVQLIKNGKIETIEDVIVDEKDAIEEVKYLKNILDEKAKEGCSSILNINNIALNIRTKENQILNDRNLDIFVSKNISPKDYKILMKSDVSKPKDFRSIIIKNYVLRDGRDDYDVYDYKQNILHERKDCSIEESLRMRKFNNTRMPSNILDLFLRKKLNKLSKEEEKMYYKYENFNLEDILFSNDREKFSLNNGDAGVITIFDDCEYKTTVTKMQHGLEKDKHIDWYMKDTNDNRRNLNYIYIQLMPGEVICWLPEKPNEYQLDRMDKFVEEVKDLEAMNHDVVVNTGIVGKSANFNTTIKEYKSLSELEQHLKNQGEKKR
ncbi:MAG: hypothetical protein Q4E39_04850 [bacterium]|nr:hypothetical protein [bacterium]